MPKAIAASDPGPRDLQHIVDSGELQARLDAAIDELRTGKRQDRDAIDIRRGVPR